MVVDETLQQVVRQTYTLPQSLLTFYIISSIMARFIGIEDTVAKKPGSFVRHIELHSKVENLVRIEWFHDDASLLADNAFDAPERGIVRLTVWDEDIAATRTGPRGLEN